MTQITAQQPRQRLNEDGRRRFVQVFGIVVVYAVCLFVAAGTLRWWNAWVYLGPVSYTHLDVYKRQAMMSLPGGRPPL